MLALYLKARLRVNQWAGSSLGTNIRLGLNWLAVTSELAYIHLGLVKKFYRTGPLKNFTRKLECFTIVKIYSWFVKMVLFKKSCR